MHAQESKGFENLNDVLIKKGQVAPHEGVLVHDLRYREYVTLLETQEMLEVELIEKHLETQRLENQLSDAQENYWVYLGISTWRFCNRCFTKFKI